MSSLYIIRVHHFFCKYFDVRIINWLFILSQSNNGYWLSIHQIMIEKNFFIWIFLKIKKAYTIVSTEKIPYTRWERYLFSLIKIIVRAICLLLFCFFFFCSVAYRYFLFYLHFSQLLRYTKSVWFLKYLLLFPLLRACPGHNIESISICLDYHRRGLVKISAFKISSSKLILSSPTNSEAHGVGFVFRKCQFSNTCPWLPVDLSLSDSRIGFSPTALLLQVVFFFFLFFGV